MIREERVSGPLALLLVKTRRPWQAQMWFTRFGRRVGTTCCRCRCERRRGRRENGGEGGGGGRRKKKEGNTVSFRVNLHEEYGDGEREREREGRKASSGIMSNTTTVRTKSLHCTADCSHLHSSK